MAEKRYCPDCEKIVEGTRCPFCDGPTYIAKHVEPESRYLGTIIDGRWRVEEKIATGGMGVVFRATQLATKATVAVKVIRSEYSQQPQIVRYFHREARVASLLNHPHTVRIMDFGQTGEGDLFIVMEYLEGVSLADLLDEEEILSPERATRIATGIVQSLAEAHSHGLVHRDLKPENVMLLDVVGQPDFVKLLDFGLAKSLSQDGSDNSMTLTGVFMGTPHYIAPERAKGDKYVDAAVDVYALGIILYEMLSGVRPFLGNTPYDVVSRHISDPVPPLPNEEELPPGLVSLVYECLEKDPARRPCAAEVMELISTEQLMEREQFVPGVKMRDLRMWTLRSLRIVAVVLAVVLMAGLAWMMYYITDGGTPDWHSQSNRMSDDVRQPADSPGPTHPDEGPERKAAVVADLIQQQDVALTAPEIETATPEIRTDVITSEIRTDVARPETRADVTAPHTGTDVATPEVMPSDASQEPVDVAIEIIPAGTPREASNRKTTIKKERNELTTTPSSENNKGDEKVVRDAPEPGSDKPAGYERLGAQPEPDKDTVEPEYERLMPE